MENFERYEEIDRYLNHEMSESELRQFENELKADQSLAEMVETQAAANAIIFESKLLDIKNTVKKDLDKIEADAAKPKLKKWWVGGAVLLGLVSVALLLKNEAEEKEIPTKKVIKEEILVTENRVLDTIQDIVISKEKVITTEDKVQVEKTNTTNTQPKGEELPQNKRETAIKEVDTPKQETSKIEKPQTVSEKETKSEPKDDKPQTTTPLVEPCAKIVIKARPTTAPACEDEQNGEIQLKYETLSGGKSPYSYSLDGAKPRQVPQSGVKYTNLSAGDYTFTIIDANSCAITIALEVTTKECMNEQQFSFNPSREPLRVTLQSDEIGVVQIRSKSGLNILQQEVQGNFEWDGRDIDGNDVASGIYHYTVQYSNGKKEQGFITVIY